MGGKPFFPGTSDKGRWSKHAIMISNMAVFGVLLAGIAFSMPGGGVMPPQPEIANPSLKAPVLAMDSDVLAIKAILGEAESEGYEGMLAVAQVIRRRGSLKGVYGRDCKRCGQISRKVKIQAIRAWFDSEKAADLTGGADVWGNSKDRAKFKSSRWFKKGKYRQTKKIGNHYFFKGSKK